MTRLIALAACGLLAVGQPVPDLSSQFKAAEQRIVRLRPSAFQQLPPELRVELERRGCLVPQDAESPRPHNVISGEFAWPGQKDWAVLCSIGGRSAILVFWAGRAAGPGSVAWADDRGFLQALGGGRIGFSRFISAAGRDTIKRHAREYRGPKPPLINHQGVDDAFSGKGSVTWYFHRGRWLALQGAD